MGTPQVPVGTQRTHYDCMYKSWDQNIRQTMGQLKVLEDENGDEYVLFDFWRNTNIWPIRGPTEHYKGHGHHLPDYQMWTAMQGHLHPKPYHIDARIGKPQGVPGWELLITEQTPCLFNYFPADADWAAWLEAMYQGNMGALKSATKANHRGILIWSVLALWFALIFKEKSGSQSDK